MSNLFSFFVLCVALLSPISSHTEASQHNTVVFMGSSSIAMWTSLQRDFPGVHAINRGVGGTQLSDAIVDIPVAISYRPRTIVLYAGENDLAVGKSTGTIFADFKVFVIKIHATLPGTRIIYISIKPDPSRWHLKNNIIAINTLIAEECARNKRLRFADVYRPMLNQQGEPDTAFFQDDKLHLNDAGYSLWRSVIAPLLK